MRQMNRTRVFVVAIVAGLLAAMLVVSIVMRQGRERQAPVEAVIAKQEIASGTIIEAGMLGSKEFPSEGLPAGVATAPGMVVGQVATQDLRVGEPISMRSISAKSRMSQIVPPFMRAVTVALDPVIGVGGFIKPGDRVDVLSTFTVDGGSITKTVLQDVRLLATGSQVVPDQQAPRESGKPSQTAELPNATLAVMPVDAEKLVLAEVRGKLRLALRRTDDTSFVVSKGVTSREVVGNVPPDVPEKTVRAAVVRYQGGVRPTPLYKLPAPTPIQMGPLPPPILLGGPEKPKGKTIEIIRGTKVEEAVVDQ